MKILLKDWYFTRALRLLFGLLIIWQAIQNMDWAAGILGLLLVLLTATNTGCRGSRDCQIVPRRTKTHTG